MFLVLCLCSGVLGVGEEWRGSQAGKAVWNPSLGNFIFAAQEMNTIGSIASNLQAEIRKIYKLGQIHMIRNVKQD